MMQIQNIRQFGTFIGLLVLCLLFWILSPYFFTVSNLLNIAQQTSIIAIISVGMTFVIITAGIDLSIGSVLAFSGVVMASALHAGVPIPLSILVGFSVGYVSGTINGLLISYGKLPPFIATLGMMSIARGSALWYTNGRPISGFSDSFRFLATGDILFIPTSVWIMAIVYIIAHFVLTKTKLGRYTYAIGGNEKAAILSGINVNRYKNIIYGVSGLLGGLGAVILTARLNSAQPIAGVMYELDAIAATVIGGTSLMGGEGTIYGTLIGALIIGVLRNGLNLLGVPSFIQQIVIGAVIIGAILLDTQLKKQKE
ncbi:MAG: ribose ABC transporter permease [Balneolales bacterium]